MQKYITYKVCVGRSGIGKCWHIGFRFSINYPWLCDKFHRFGYFNPRLETFTFQKVLWYLLEKLLPKHTKHNATFSYDDTVGTVVDGEYYETSKKIERKK